MLSSITIAQATCLAKLNPSPDWDLWDTFDKDEDPTPWAPYNFDDQSEKNWNAWSSINAGIKGIKENCDE